MMATAEDPDDRPLSPAEITEQIAAAGVSLTTDDLSALIAAARAQHRPCAAELFPLKPLLPPHIAYETARRACASGKLRATKVGADDDWYSTKADVAQWLRENPKRWFESEAAAQEWRAILAALKPRWIA
jgi:hypothetical protein